MIRQTARALIVRGTLARGVDTINAFGSTSLTLWQLATATSFQSMATCTGQSHPTTLPDGFGLGMSGTLERAIEIEALTMGADRTIALAADFTCSAFSTGVGRSLRGLGRAHDLLQRTIKAGQGRTSSMCRMIAERGGACRGVKN